MTTVWHYSSHTEALRILHAAKNIASGFYRLNNFVVLPPTGTKVNANSVIYPDLPYLSVPRFWERAARIDIKTVPSIKMNIPKDLISSTEKLIASQAKLKTGDFSAVKGHWDQNRSRIINSIYRLIPSARNQIQSITIWPTGFGTTCSFNDCTTPPYHIHLWLRSDCDLAEIVEAILTSLTRSFVYKNLDGLWSESEMLVDWLMTQSNLATVLQSAGVDLAQIGTIKAVRAKQQASLIKKSQDFLTKIGAPVVDISVIKNLDTARFSVREKQLFNLLVQSSPQVVSFDAIYDNLYQTNAELFSLYAISKTVQRLRDRLEESGVSGSFIQTKRGEGYLLAS